MHRTLTALLFSTTLAAPALAATQAEVAKTYSDIAAASFGDSLSAAQALQLAVKALIAAPSEQSLNAARATWLASARRPFAEQADAANRLALARSHAARHRA